MKFLGYEIYPGQLLCFFGWHDWSRKVRNITTGRVIRYCHRCHLERFEK